MSSKSNTNPNGVTPAEKATERLTTQFPTKVFAGKTGIFHLWDAKQADVTPACRVEPESAQDVSSMLKILVEEQCPFAVKGGGNARGVGSSNVEGGVMIDLRRMNAVHLAADRKSAKFGAGANWLDVYSQLDPQGLTVLGGRVSTVGVGGFLLGGGMSFYSGRLGWACDSIISYEIVLPNGDIAEVNQQNNPELFRALRGAGSTNFGIVTAFELEAIHMPNPRGIWMGSRMYTQDKVPQLLEQMHGLWASTIDEDLDLSAFNFYVFNPAQNVFVAITFRLHATHDHPTDWPKSLSSFESIESIPGTSNGGVVPIAASAAALGANVPPGKRNAFMTFSYTPSHEFETALYQQFEEEVIKLKDVAGFQAIMISQPVARSTISFMAKRGGNCLGLRDGDGPLIVLGYNWIYLDAADDGRVEEAAKRTLDRAEQTAKQLGAWHAWKYLNYADEKLQVRQVWEGYGGENVERLRGVQRSVDPMGIFTDGGLASGYFKLN